jgi:Holliday junction resolvasome RuvABC endonuclease subunit
MPKKFGNEQFRAKNIAIGIDQSLTGFAMAFIDCDNPENYFAEVFRSKYSGVQRLDNIAEWMDGSIDYFCRDNIVDVAMEGTVLASHSALVLGELSATVKLTLYRRWEVLPLQVPPMTLKKYATGKGNSKKQEMLMQMYKRWGVEFNDDNAADAYALSRVAAGIYIHDTEQAIIEQLKDLKYRDQIVD